MVVLNLYRSVEHISIIKKLQRIWHKEFIKEFISLVFSSLIRILKSYIMKPKIGITEKDKSAIIEKLTVVLANEMVVYVKTRKFHWNVTGNSFMELHKLFEKQYNDIALAVDEVAERISKLGGKAIGSMDAFLKHATLKESKSDPAQKAMIEELLSDHEEAATDIRKFINEIEEDTDDIGTADFLTDLLRDHESKAWVLRKYLA